MGRDFRARVMEMDFFFFDRSLDRREASPAAASPSRPPRKARTRGRSSDDMNSTRRFSSRLDSSRARRPRRAPLASSRGPIVARRLEHRIALAHRHGRHHGRASRDGRRARRPRARVRRVLARRRLLRAIFCADGGDAKRAARVAGGANRAAVARGASRRAPGRPRGARGATYSRRSHRASLPPRCRATSAPRCDRRGQMSYYFGGKKSARRDSSVKRSVAAARTNRDRGSRAVNRRRL